MSVFDKTIKVQAFDKDGRMIYEGCCDLLLEELYQDFKERYNEECKKDEMETRRITEKLRKQLIKDGLLTED